VFEGTLADNLRMCESVNGPPSDGEFLHALGLAKVNDFIEPSPAGLETAIAERAANWSGGQRARVALARGILAARGSSIVLLDEPTASLDPTATEAVEAIVREIRTDGARVVMATHNLAQALRLADDIVFIDKGRAVEHAPAARFFSRPQAPEARLFLQGELPWRISFDS
jgi:tungstate transport system ATP-binding protein